MLARRLLIAGGGGSFTIPLPFTITSAPYGGWTQIPEARALHVGATTYIGFVTGTDGDVGIVTVPDGGTPAAPIILHAAFQVDSHAAPAMIVDSVSGKLLTMYSGHNGALLYTRRSVNTVASDPTLSGGFDTETTIAQATVTYPILLQRNAETDSPIYAWYRTGSGAATKLAYRKSTDGGVSWSASTTVYEYAGAYWKITTDSQWRIDFLVTSGGPPGDSSIYHFYADDTDYHQSDGTVITAFPIGPGDATQVYDFLTDGAGWPTDAILDGSNNPRMVYTVNNAGNTDSYYGYARWTGSAWTLSTILTSAGVGTVDPSPVGTLDAASLTTCHLVRYISGQYEIWRYTTTDNGATWTGRAITAASAVKNLYPVKVHDHASGALGVVWLAGSYTGSESGYSLGIVGLTVT